VRGEVVLVKGRFRLRRALACTALYRREYAGILLGSGGSRYKFFGEVTICDNLRYWARFTIQDFRCNTVREEPTYCA